MKFRTILIALVLASSMCMGDALNTYHSGWHLVRETANEDGATFAAVYNLTTSGNFANKDSSSVLLGGAFEIPSRIEQGSLGVKASQGAAWIFTICGENFNNVDDTFSFNLIGWAKDNGMLQVICEGSGVLGTQGVIAYPDDAADALGATVSVTGATYDNTGGATEKLFTDTADVGSFSGAVVGMLAYVTGTNITSGYYQVTTVTDANNIAIAVTATGDNTNSTVQINPAFWADTITLDETTKWPSVSVKNSGDNEVAQLIVDLTGIEWVQMVIYDSDGQTGEEAGNLTVYGRPY